MPKYAQNTEVSVEQSKLEIERTIHRYGASEFAYGWVSDKAMISFTIGKLRVRFVLPLPAIEEFRLTPERGFARSEKAQRDAWEQGCRQRWRALNLCIKAKLEAVECGIATFEDEFLSYIVLPSNQTIGEALLPQIDNILQTGVLPKLLPAIGESGLIN